MNEDEIKKLRDDLDELEEKLADSGEKTGRQAAQKVREYAAMLKEKSRQAAAGVKEAGKHANEYVEGHPWQMIGAGVLVGMIAGLMIGRSITGRNRD